MKNISLALSLFLITSTAFAGEAHVHGAVKIEMAVEGKTLTIDFDGPADSFVGFEHTAQSAAEKKAWTNAETLWKRDLITKLFVLDKNLGCKVTEASFKQEEEKHVDTKHEKHHKESGVHSDIEAAGTITCNKDLAGQNLVVAVKKQFPKIRKLLIELVSLETRTIEINSNEQTIKL